MNAEQKSTNPLVFMVSLRSEPEWIHGPGVRVYEPHWQSIAWRSRPGLHCLEMDDIEKKAAAQIGESVRACRGRLGWSQATLAERIGTSVEYVSFLERGERLPSVGTLMRLSKALRVPVAVLFGEADVPADEKKDPALALLSAVPAAARPAVLGMLRGVIQAYRSKRKRG